MKKILISEEEFTSLSKAACEAINEASADLSWVSGVGGQAADEAYREYHRQWKAIHDRFAAAED